MKRRLLIIILLLCMFGCNKTVQTEKLDSQENKNQENINIEQTVNQQVQKTEAVLKVEIMIDAIGTVSLDSEPSINQAKTAYDALSDQEKTTVENYSVLEEATEAYQSLCDEKDKDEVKKVETLISEIGEITINSYDQLSAALDAYSALSPKQQEMVGNYSSLLSAAQLWTSKYDFVGNTYYCGEWGVYNSGFEEITKSNSLYVNLLGKSNDVYVKIADDHSKIIYSNQYGIYFGELINHDYHEHNGKLVTCNISWEKEPTVIEREQITFSEITVYYNKGNAYLWFILNGDPNETEFYDAYANHPNSILVYHELHVVVQ